MKNTSLSLLLAAAIAGFPASAFAIGSLADIDIVDRVQNRALPVYWHQGRAYIAGEPGHEYRIALRNRAHADVLAVVSVDGVNVVSGETASVGQSGYVVNNGQRLDITGWRKSLVDTAAFYFTALPDSYAARTGRPNNVGVIGVALFRRKYSPPPAISLNEAWAPEADGAAGAAGASAADQDRAKRTAPGAPAASPQHSLGTGHGRREYSSAQYVDFERATTAPEERITLYYDSFANLVAMGVIPPATRGLPQPFPGSFVPDPR
jgi:hypothetical protein